MSRSVGEKAQAVNGATQLAERGIVPKLEFFDQDLQVGDLHAEKRFRTAMAEIGLFRLRIAKFLERVQDVGRFHGFKHVERVSAPEFVVS